MIGCVFGLGKRKDLPPNCYRLGRRFFCPCGIPFNTIKGLWEHWEDFHKNLVKAVSREIIKEKVFICENCNAFFSSEYDLVRHLVVCYARERRRQKRARYTK